MTAYDKMYVVLPWRIAEDLVKFIVSQYGLGRHELRGGMGCTATECFETLTVIVDCVPGSVVQLDVDEWLFTHGNLGWLEPWVNPVEWTKENPWLSEEYVMAIDELKQILEEVQLDV